MCIISGVVIQWWWCRYGYTIQLFYEYYMRHGPCLRGVCFPADHSMTSNYTPYMRSCYPGFRNQEPRSWTMYLISGPMIMTRVWICYPIVVWVLYDACATSDRGGSHQIPQHDLQLHPRHAQLLPWFWNQEVEPCTSSVVWWSKGNDVGIAMLLYYCMSIIWGMLYTIWQGGINPRNTVWPPTTPYTCSAVLPGFLETCTSSVV